MDFTGVRINVAASTVTPGLYNVMVGETVVQTKLTVHGALLAAQGELHNWYKARIAALVGPDT